MDPTRQLTLSAEQAAYIDAQIASGRHASASDVLSEALAVLQSRDEWLLSEAVPVYDEMQAHPERAISGDRWMERIVELHGAHTKGEG